MSLPQPLPLDFAIICDEEELQMYDVKQDHNSKQAYVASEAGKVIVS